MAASEISKTQHPAPHRQTDVFGAMRDEMDRMFERFEHGWPRWPAALLRGSNGRDLLVPELDVHESDKQFMIEVDLPGVEEKDVTVSLANGLLTIKGEKKVDREEKKDNYYMAERSYGSFQRSLRLPDTIDDTKLEARFDKGVLKIAAQKKPDAIRAERKIEIKKS